MELNIYQKKALVTNAASSDNESYSLFGLFAEAGELADKVAKAVRKKIITINNDFIFEAEEATKDEVGTKEYYDFIEGIKKELGDVLWFVAHLAYRFNWDLEDVAQANLDKLAKRKAENTIITHQDH